MKTWTTPVPYAVQQMSRDYWDYGTCGCIVVDTPNHFILQRLNPRYMLGYNYD